MTKPTDHLRDAQIHELVGGIFGWLWIISSIAFVVWLIGAIVSDWSWLAVLGWFLGSGFLKAVAREYNKSAQKAIQDGISSGQLAVDEQGRAVRTGR